MIHKFTDEQVEEINKLGLISRYGAMQGSVVFDENKPLSFNSFVEQYEEQARYAKKLFDGDDRNWKMLAELWADVDMDLIRGMK